MIEGPSCFWTAPIDMKLATTRTEDRFLMNHPEGPTLTGRLTAEKKQSFRVQFSTGRERKRETSQKRLLCGKWRVFILLYPSVCSSVSKKRSRLFRWLGRRPR